MILSADNQLLREKKQRRCRLSIAVCNAGQAIIEFALLAPVFLGMLLGVFEFSGILFAQTLLEGGAREASRFGITGNSEAGTSREVAIRQIIDDNTFGIIDIDELGMETVVYQTFSDVGQPEPFTDENGNGVYDENEPFTDINGNDTYDEDMGQAGLGGPGEVVVYRLSYDWAIMIPIFEPFFGETVRLESSIAVRNEPFGS